MENTPQPAATPAATEVFNDPGSDVTTDPTIHTPDITPGPDAIQTDDATPNRATLNGIVSPLDDPDYFHDEHRTCDAARRSRDRLPHPTANRHARDLIRRARTCPHVDIEHLDSVTVSVRIIQPDAPRASTGLRRTGGRLQSYREGTSFEATAHVDLTVEGAANAVNELLASRPPLSDLDLAVIPKARIVSTGTVTSVHTVSLPCAETLSTVTRADTTTRVLHMRSGVMRRTLDHRVDTIGDGPLGLLAHGMTRLVDQKASAGRHRRRTSHIDLVENTTATGETSTRAWVTSSHEAADPEVHGRHMANVMGLVDWSHEVPRPLSAETAPSELHTILPDEGALECTMGCIAAGAGGTDAAMRALREVDDGTSTFDRLADVLGSGALEPHHLQEGAHFCEHIVPPEQHVLVIPGSVAFPPLADLAMITFRLDFLDTDQEPPTDPETRSLLLFEAHHLLRQLDHRLAQLRIAPPLFHDAQPEAIYQAVSDVSEQRDRVQGFIHHLDPDGSESDGSWPTIQQLLQKRDDVHAFYQLVAHAADERFETHEGGVLPTLRRSLRNLWNDQPEAGWSPRQQRRWASARTLIAQADRLTAAALEGDDQAAERATAAYKRASAHCVGLQVMVPP